MLPDDEWLAHLEPSRHCGKYRCPACGGSDSTVKERHQVGAGGPIPSIATSAGSTRNIHVAELARKRRTPW